MKPTPGAARILIASDNTDDAAQIQRQLKTDFTHTRASTVADHAMQDFDEYKPDVLVLAFDSLDRAQTYYLGLYRTGQSLMQHPHRTVVLCSKDEVRNAFELCKKEYFDDYVLYWPHTHDGPRLVMSIWNACREMMVRRSDAPGAAQLLAHSRHLAELDRTLALELADVDQLATVARQSLAQVEGDIGLAFDEFSRNILHGGEPETLAGLAEQIDRLKQHQLLQTRRLGVEGLEPVNAWATRFKGQIDHALAGTRELTEQLRKLRMVVMVVDDDELIQKLVLRTLDHSRYELLPAADEPAALALLRRVRPDAILMDINLPGIDGLMLTQRLKAVRHLADIPIIMMTGDARRETLVSSIEGGAAAFVVKPFTRESLNANLEKALRR